ncbi:hypothetical protein Fcan01_26886 [Folsomia candida]|uniref:F-box domain-containing protein n=1 Tax=Folsomia candida TaxID=158441 RepID=A0A226D295_FOLCA|nr:hypothetical protein Fcan01_26886 [Folsomia candida]
MPRKKKSGQKSVPTSNVEILPTLNTDVISSICSWLPVPDVKNCRLVSRTWNVAAKPILKQKSVINLECSFHKGETARNAKFKREMASFGRPLNHVDISLDEFAIVDFKSKLYLDHVKFFTKDLSVQKLGISSQISSIWMSQFLEQILVNASPNLVQVELGLYVYGHLMKGEDPFIEFCGGKIFATVKRLELPFSATNWSLGTVRVPQILAAFPNIEELRVSAELLPVLFLSKLWVTSGMTGSKCAALLNLTQPLKHLNIERAHNPSDDEDDWDEEVDVVPSLYEVLSKHRHTLEYLDLGLSAKCDWKFPPFPNLKRLNFLSDLEGYGFSVEFDGSRILNYSTTFPKLESLNFTPWDGRWTRCFQPFFHANAAICQSVKRLDISDNFKFYEYDNLIDMFKAFDGVDAKFARILNLFPNADNVFMQELKRYLAKKGVYK